MRHDGVVDVTRTARAARAQNAFGFVNEDENQMARFGFFARDLKDFTNLPLGFAQPHIENLRAVDEHEILFQILPGRIVKSARDIISRRFAD